MMFTDFPGWWEGLSTIAKIYWIIAFPSTLLFIIQLVMTFIGGDGDHDTDTDADHSMDHDTVGFNLFTIKNLIGFFTLFAWSGLACIDGGFALATILIVSFVCGFVMMLVMASLFYYISKFAYSGTMDFKNAIGVKGSVYLSIPARKTGNGKVQVKVQGALRTLDAITEDPEIIKTGSLIEVVEIGTNNLLVVKRVR
jgi:membrane protein implicated in regulation of membrane protease activity